jgi:integrase
MDGQTTNQAPRTITVRVIVRHSSDCKDKKKGSEWRKCDCRKSLLIYEGQGTGTNRRVSAKTRSWEKAETEAQRWRDKLDPFKQELNRLRAAKERQQVRLEDAVALYVADMITRLGDNGTVRMTRSLFGHVDPQTKAIIKNGHLFDWLDRLPPSERPTHIADFNAALITKWRASWDFDSDLTAANRWTMVKSFFNFCEGQGWIEDNPCRKLKRIAVKKGNRTAVFTDEQYASILKAVPRYDPENTPAQTREAWQRRLTTFLELLRWSGMALTDAVQFRPEWVDSKGVLRYRRQKTQERAVVPLPKRLLTMLADVPLERDSLGPEQPFRTNPIVNSDTRKWERRLCELFKLAGIAEVRTDLGTLRKPHPHMLRDTFAVSALRHGAGLHTVAKMLGHAKTTTTERAYLPWVQELEDAHIADARKALSQAGRSNDR